MRIAYLVVKNIQRGGGIEKYTLEVGKRLAAKGHEITVFSMPHYGHVDYMVDGMRIVKVPCLKHAAAEKLSAGAMGALLSAMNFKNYDILHFHSVAAGAFGLLPRLRGLKTVLQMHGIEWQRTRWSASGLAVLKALEAISLKSHNAYTAVSKIQCDFYQRYHGIAMQYIPTGADVMPAQAPREILSMGLMPGKYILFASRLVREKGAHYLIKAFRELKTDNKLIIAGDAAGEETYKTELKQAAFGDDRILFPGYVEGKKLAELFSHAAIYVQPSEVEGLSIALLEAMGYGICCLASDIPENKEAIGDTGFTFRSKDIGDLKAKLEFLLLNPEPCAVMGALGRARVREYYSWDGIAAEFEGLYRSLV